MLLSLQVRNFAIIDAVDVEFERGMTVLTGETGAGKSILVDALGLVLGERGGTGLVRGEADRAEFTAEFDLAAQPDVREWLVQQTLDQGDACVIRRVIAADGRSRAFINGNAVPLQSLKALGEQLLDIHGQHFHQSLGRRDVQRSLVDHFGALDESRMEGERAFAEWQALAGRLQELTEAEADRSSRIDLLTFQVRELEALNLEPGEYDVLLSERQRFRMSAQLVDGVTRALKAIYEDEEANAQALLADASHQLEAISVIDASLESAQSLLEEASIQVSEAAETLHRYRDALDLDPERLDRVEERLDAVSTLARKHRVEPAGLPDLHRRLARQLDDLTNAEATGGRLARETEAARAGFLGIAERLTAARTKAAAAFASKVTEAMHGLGMPDGRFEVALTRRTVDDARSWGLDDVEFRISANAGQPPMPLGRVASGGELSRMSLSIQVIASDGSSIPTMVFDEVDAGVGGAVAEMVGRRLRELGADRQVFCVTHLPQVASVADHHFRVTKLTDGKTTRTEVTPLAEERKVDELARMLGGVDITEQSRKHAAEMRRLGKRTGRRKVRTAS
jgi:DNA repair protein RecN (Recombination protein N)